MSEILIPLTFDDLPTRPPLVGRPRISDDLQQAISMVVGWDGRTRRFIRCSESGILRTASPRTLKSKKHTGGSPNEKWSPASALCSECLVRAASTNTGVIYVQMDGDADTVDAWPLSANECVKVEPDNLANIHILTQTTGDKTYFFPSR